MQFCPFQYGSPPGPEALARSLSSSSSSGAPPSDDGRDENSTTPLHPDTDQFTPAPRLPLPWTQFYLPLPRPAATEQPMSEKQLYEIYSRLLRTSKEYIASIESSENSGGGADTDNDNNNSNRARIPPAGPKRDSYNLFLTSQHMHLVPRTDRLVALERGDHHGGDDLLRISLNGLVYLGYWHVPSNEDWDLVRKAGLGRVLQRAAYINEQYHQQG